MSNPSRLSALWSGVRFGQFVSVGAVGAVFDLTTLLVLTEIAGLEPAIANVLSIETAILVMFAINERWTFAEAGAAGRGPLGRRLVRSHVVRATGSTVQYLLFVAVFYTVTVDLVVAGLDAWLVVVKGCAIVAAMVVNYVFESLFTWRVHRDTTADR
jgi:putative flippase GtrA